MDTNDLNRTEAPVKTSPKPEYEPPRLVDLGGTTTGVGLPAGNCTSGAAAGGSCAVGSGFAN